MQKSEKKSKNTVFTYKKWSNPESDEWKSSATPNMWWVSFIRILIRCLEKAVKESGILAVFPPPPARLVSIWRTLSQNEFFFPSSPLIWKRSDVFMKGSIRKIKIILVGVFWMPKHMNLIFLQLKKRLERFLSITFVESWDLPDCDVCNMDTLECSLDSMTSGFNAPGEGAGPLCGDCDEDGTCFCSCEHEYGKSLLIFHLSRQ